MVMAMVLVSRKEHVIKIKRVLSLEELFLELFIGIIFLIFTEPGGLLNHVISLYANLILNTHIYITFAQLTHINQETLNEIISFFLVNVFCILLFSLA